MERVFHVKGELPAKKRIILQSKISKTSKSHHHLVHVISQEPKIIMASVETELGAALVFFYPWFCRGAKLLFL